jgi:phosphatidylserine/phosphatidylglycerophosphate/cardiolipin synthase-like enzyme
MRGLRWLAVAGLLVALSSCKLTVSQQAESQPGGAPPPAGAVPAHPAEAAAGSLRLLVEPAAGIGPIYRLITGARSSVTLTMYELRDPVAEHDLAADAERGVDVRVVMTADTEWDTAFAALKRAGVHVRLFPDSSRALTSTPRPSSPTRGMPASRLSPARRISPPPHSTATGSLASAPRADR